MIPEPKDGNEFTPPKPKLNKQTIEHRKRQKELANFAYCFPDTSERSQQESRKGYRERAHQRKAKAAEKRAKRAQARRPAKPVVINAVYNTEPTEQAENSVNREPEIEYITLSKNKRIRKKQLKMIEES